MQPEPRARIELVQPSIDQEAASIWMTINTYEFLEGYGYDIRLPEDSLIDALIEKSREGTFGEEDYSAIYTLLENGLFAEEDYSLAMADVEDKLDLLNTFIADIESTSAEWDWDFKLYETYQIQFTLYGTGGGYNPDLGIITLLTSKEGEYVRYKNPASIIIHEITHIGLEHSIVQKYELSHGMKERLIDTFVTMMFIDDLPEYTMQNMGDERMDEYFKSREDLAHLETSIVELLADSPQD